MSEVIVHDFGKEDRGHIRRFLRLLGMLEAHDEAVRADPVKYLNQAGAEITRLRTEIFDAWEVVAQSRRAFTVGDGPPSPTLDIIRVDRREYEALREVYARITRLAGMA